MITEDELTDIINDYVTVTDSWGGGKLASWMHGNDVVIAGVSEASEAIFSRIKKLYEEKEKEMLRFAEWCLHEKHVSGCEVFETGNCSCGVPETIGDAFEYWKNNVQGK